MKAAATLSNRLACWCVVGVWDECHRDAPRDGDGRVVVNAIRVVGHVDNKRAVRGGIQRAIAAVAAAVHLRVRV